LTGIRVVALLAVAANRAHVANPREPARSSLATELRRPIRDGCRNSGMFEIKITPAIQLALLSGQTSLIAPRTKAYKAWARIGTREHP
jgi:hypothetical protein